jgi:hypothetical protein
MGYEKPHLYRYRLMDAVTKIRGAIDGETHIFLEALGYEHTFGTYPEIIRAALDELGELRAYLVKIETRIARLKPPQDVDTSRQ